jgi:hypothetical protein
MEAGMLVLPPITSMKLLIGVSVAQNDDKRFSPFASASTECLKSSL